MTRESVVAVIMTFVAINTLMCLGLSMAKLIPWPHPLHPRILRTRLGIHAQARPRSDDIGEPLGRDRHESRLEVVRGFLALGSVLLIAGVLSALMPSGQRAIGVLALVIASLGLLVAAGTLYPTSVSPGWTHAMWCGAIAAAGAVIAAGAVLQPNGPTFIATIMVLGVIGAVRIPWRFFVVTAGVMAIAALSAMAASDSPRIPFGAGAVAVTIMSAAVLRTSLVRRDPAEDIVSAETAGDLALARNPTRPQEPRNMWS